MKDFNMVTDDKLLKFRPDDYITIYEAANMLDAALGYRKLAEKTYSARIDILDGVRKSTVAAATLDDIYIMLENCLVLTFFEPETWEILNETTKETVLERRYGLEKRRGVVTANPLTGISEAENSSAKGYLEIDGVEFKSIDSEYEKYLGYMVDFYVDRVNDEIFFVEPYKHTDILTIDSEDILPSNQNTIFYKVGETKTKNVTIRNYDVIYNKKAYSGYGNLNSILSGIDGYITLLDRNGDKIYDVVFIDSYTHHYISSVDMQFGYVYDEDTNERIDLSDEENTYIYKADGTRIKVAGISADTLISVAESKNIRGKKVRTIYLSDAVIEGKVSEIYDEEIMINGTYYKCCDSVFDEVSLGSYGQFIVGKTGKIVKYIPLTEATWNVGIVYAKEDRFSSVKVKLFTADNEFKIYPIAKKARADKTSESETVKGNSDVCKALKIGEVIRYQLNDAGEVKRVQQVDGNEDKAYADDTGIRMLKSGNSFHYYQNMYARSFGTNDKTQFFVIPSEEAWENEDEFSASPITFANDREIKYAYEAYTFGEKDIPIADVMVIKGGTAATIKTSEYMFALNEIRCVVEGGEEIYKLSGVSKGKNVSFLSEENPKMKYNIENGDIILVRTGSNGMVENIIKVFTLNSSNNADAYIKQGVNDISFGIEASRVTGAYVYVHATVTGITSEGIAYKYLISGENAFGFLKSTTYTRYNIDGSNTEAVPGTVNDIVVGDEILIVTNYAKPNQIIVFKNR